MFSSLNSLTSSLGSLKVSELVSQAQAGLKHVEHSLDTAMGINVQQTRQDANHDTAAISSQPKKALAAGAPAADPSTVQGLGADHQRQLASAGGDFFGSFLANAAAAVSTAATTVTASAAAATKTATAAPAASQPPPASPTQDKPAEVAVDALADNPAPPAKSLASVLQAEPLPTDSASGWNDGFDDWPDAASPPTESASEPTVAASANLSSPVRADVNDEASAAATAGADETAAASADIDIDLPVEEEETAQSEQEDAATSSAAADDTMVDSAASDTAAAAAQAAAAESAAAEAAAAEAEAAAQAAEAAAAAKAQEEAAERQRIEQGEQQREQAEREEAERQRLLAAAAAEAERVQQEEAAVKKRAAEKQAFPVATPHPDQPPASSSLTATTIAHPLAVDVSPAHSKPAHAPSPSPSPAQATPRVTPVAATLPSSSSSASPDSALQSALDRARQAEEAVSKLNRLLKIRELQLEKQSLESSRAQDALTKAEERLNASSGAAERDRERLERKYNELQRTVAQLQAEKDAQRSRNDSSEADRMALTLKDQQIAAVMEEGAVLQQKQQKLELAIKRLRKEAAAHEEAIRKADADRTDSEKTMADLTTKYSDLKDKYTRVREDLQEANLRATALEQKTADGESLAHASTNTIHDLRYALQQAQDALRDKENELLKLQHELQAQHRTKASSSEELEQMKKAELAATERESNLLRNVQELQVELERERAAAAAREEAHAAELALASQKLSASEARAEELISAVPAATRPLLRQIESYASALSSSKEAWAGLEAALQKRAHELELSLIKAKSERERSETARQELALEHEEVSAKCRTLNEKLLALEAAHRTLKASASALEEQARETNSQSEDRLHQLLSLQAERDDLKGRLRALADSGASGEKKMESLYLNEKLLRERLEAQLEHLKNAPTASAAAASASAAGDGEDSSSLPVSAGSSPPDAWSAGSSSGSPHVLHFGSSKQAVTSTVELLRSLLQQKEGEIKSLKELNRQLEAGKASLSDELVLLTSQLNSSSLSQSRVATLEAALAAMTRRHDAACLIIGEKEEELEDLRADALQAKQLFQQQIALLGEHIEQLKKK